MERDSNVSIVIGANLKSGFMNTINRAKDSLNGFNKKESKFILLICNLLFYSFFFEK